MDLGLTGRGTPLTRIKGGVERSHSHRRRRGANLITSRNRASYTSEFQRSVHSTAKRRFLSHLPQHITTCNAGQEKAVSTAKKQK